MNEPTPPSQPGQAEASTLRELLAVSAHDLSNPLQSMTVLTELAADELGEAHPVALKLNQALEAAGEMREMVRHLAKFARSGSTKRSTAQVVDNVLQVLRRRFERQRVHLDHDLGSAATAEVPASPLPVTLLAVGLGVVRVAAESRDRGLTLPLTLRLRGARREELVELAFDLTDAKGTHAPLSPHDVARVRACLGPAGRIETTEGGWTLTVGATQP